MKTNDGAPIRILLVEKNAEVCESLVFLLSQLGCEVVAVATGAAAMAECGRQPFHAVYSSLILDDMHGCQLAVCLRAYPGMRASVIVALTGYFQPGIEADCRNAGFDCYLLKPVPLDAVLSPLKAIPDLAASQTLENGSARLRSGMGSFGFSPLH